MCPTGAAAVPNCGQWRRPRERPGRRKLREVAQDLPAAEAALSTIGGTSRPLATAISTRRTMTPEKPFIWTADAK